MIVQSNNPILWYARNIDNVLQLTYNNIWSLESESCKYYTTYISQQTDASSIQFHSHCPNTRRHPVSPSKSIGFFQSRATKYAHSIYKLWREIHFSVVTIQWLI